MNSGFCGYHYDIQSTLDNLDQNLKYFTISQHDDCILENYEFRMVIFSMGGNKSGKDIIPIPLICSPIGYEEGEKEILASFIGSETHGIRKEIVETYSNDPDFFIKNKGWELVTSGDNITSRSKLTICPRGYGKSSFRMYEAMQLNSVPVYISDEEWLPWTEEINWDNLAIRVHSSEIKQIKDRILSADYKSMIDYKKMIYDEYFTFPGVYDKIIKRIKKHQGFLA